MQKNLTNQTKEKKQIYKNHGFLIKLVVQIGSRISCVSRVPFDTRALVLVVSKLKFYSVPSFSESFSSLLTHDCAIYEVTEVTSEVVLRICHH